MLGGVLCAVAWGGQPSSQEDDRLAGIIDQARASSSVQQWDDAAEAWRAVLDAQPDHAEASVAIRKLYDDGLVRISVDDEEVGTLEQTLGHGFFRVETPWFIILSDCGEVWTAARAGVLERAARQYRRTMDALDLRWQPPAHKLVCVLFAEHGDFVAFAGESDGVQASWVAGYYATHTNHAAFYDEATSPSVQRASARIEEAKSSADRDHRRDLTNAKKDLMTHAREASIAKTIHEAIHMLAFNCGLQRRSRSYPFWFTEGLASSFETTDPRRAFGPASDEDSLAEELSAKRREGVLISITELIGVTDPKEIDSARAAVLYAESHSFFRYLYRYEREELARYSRALWRAQSRELSGASHVALFREHIGDEKKLERRWLKRSKIEE